MKCVTLRYNQESKERENKMINYVSANDGGLVFHTENDEVFSSTSVENLAAFAVKKGFAEVVMGSSSMDFASEYGFKTDEGASLMLKRVLELV